MEVLLNLESSHKCESSKQRQRYKIIVADETAAEAVTFGIDTLSAALPTDRVFNPSDQPAAKPMPCDCAFSLTQCTPHSTPIPTP